MLFYEGKVLTEETEFKPQPGSNFGFIGLENAVNNADFALKTKPKAVL